MSHPDNEPGKSYDDCERRREAVFNACDGIPTEWLERGLIKQMYAALMVIALADKLKDAELDKMNDIATAGKAN